MFNKTIPLLSLLGCLGGLLVFSTTPTATQTVSMTGETVTASMNPDDKPETAIYFPVVTQNK